MRFKQVQKLGGMWVGMKADKDLGMGIRLFTELGQHNGVLGLGGNGEV